MLEEILCYLHNWFPVEGAARYGVHRIESGRLQFDGLEYGQYYRIQGSTFNDGLHVWDEDLMDETFTGTVTPLAIPRALSEGLTEEIDAWVRANPATDKVSESFGGYTYSRQTGASGGWQAAFASRLARWRRPCE
jgi:hypothetical protein